MEGNYGILLNQNIKLHRRYFKELVKLIGIQVLYQYPLDLKTYNLHGELESNYSEAIKVGCIFEEHVSQKTAKLLGWDAELQTEASLIHVPYDLEHLQIGSKFLVPSAYDNTKGRMFRVVEIYTNQLIYPASVICRLVLDYTTTAPKSEIELFNTTDFNLLNEG